MGFAGAAGLFWWGAAARSVGIHSDAAHRARGSIGLRSGAARSESTTDAATCRRLAISRSEQQQDRGRWRSPQDRAETSSGTWGGALVRRDCSSWLVVVGVAGLFRVVGLGRVPRDCRQGCFSEFIFGAFSGGCCGGSGGFAFWRLLGPGAAAGLSGLLMDRGGGGQLQGARRDPPAAPHLQVVGIYAVLGRTGRFGPAPPARRRAPERWPSTARPRQGPPSPR